MLATKKEAKLTEKCRIVEKLGTTLYLNNYLKSYSNVGHFLMLTILP